MNSNAITPEVMGNQTMILESSPMTEAEEKELVMAKTAIEAAFADKMERDLAIGKCLLLIFRRKLYRGAHGGRTWEQWLAEESAEMTAGRGPLGKDTARYLQGFYQFRVEVLSPAGHGPRSGVALPTSARQIRPLLGQLDSHPEAALEMWKAACAQAGKGKVPTFDQVNRAALAYKANEANEARRLSSSQQASQQKAVAASVANRPLPTPTPAPTTQTIPAWELEKDGDALDAGAECKRITQAVSDALKSIGLLRGILYSQINKYGRDYLGTLRMVDAGIYSLHSIDAQVEQMGDDISFIADLLIADTGEGELASATLSVEAFPVRA